MNYEGFGIRHIGASHIQKGIVCQDSVQYHQDLQTVSAAVSDGHGGQPYFRSNRGSAFAAEISCRYMTKFLHQHSELNEGIRLQDLTDQILQEWHEAVKKDLLSDPFTSDEMKHVPDKHKEAYLPFSQEQRSDVLPETFPHCLFSAYGATLICLGFCENYGIGLHIGDGKCVAIYPDGKTDEPIPWDENCHLNLCTSICDSHADQEFRFHIWEKNDLPIAVFAASDGIDDSFAERLHIFYLHVAMEFISSGFRKGVLEIEKQLPGISERGSQDDVSICGIVNMSALNAVQNVIQEKADLLQRNMMLSVINQKLTELQFCYDKTQRILSACTEEEQEKRERNLLKLEKFSAEMEELRQKKAELETPKVAVPENEPESDVSDPIPENQPESDVSDPIPEDEPESDISDPIPEDEPESDVSDPIPEDEPESDVSDPVPENQPEPDVSDPDNEATLVDSEDW